MQSRILSIGIVFILTISTFRPGAADAHRQPTLFQQTNIQGEIAYVKDGDIWLLDLFTGESQPLTTDGDNRWPAWSSDGRYLLYTHGDPEAQADLYLLDVGQGAPSLLVENACCAAWSLDHARIAYLSLAGAELSIETIQLDGSNKTTIIPAVQAGRSSTPTGNLLWIPAKESAGNADQFVVPLQVIGGAGGGLTRSEDVFGLDTTDSAPISLYGEMATCFRRNYTVMRVGESLLEAIAFTGSAGCGGETQQDKGILITKDAQADRELPWLAYPSFSPDGKVLAAERYQAASDPTKAELEGIIVHNLADDSEQMVMQGGAQPAWRPGSDVDPVVARYLQAGERAIAIQPVLVWQGSTYQVHYLTTGTYRKRDAGLFTPPTPAFFADQGITALIVTKDGQVVTDAATLRQIFLLYTAAYYLYEKPPEEFVLSVREELDNVLNNPIFQALSVGELLRTPRAQTAETLRALLTDRVSEKTTLEPLFDQAFATTPKDAEAALDAFSGVVENQAAHDAVLLALKPDLAAAYANLGDAVKGSKYHLQLIRLATQLLFTSHLQAERAGWLESYANAFVDGAGSLDRDQLNAAADVLAEVQSSSQQRIDIAADFMTQMSGQAILDLSGAAATKAATQLLTQMGEKFGVRLASNAVAGTLAAVSVGASLGNLLYGSDELFANFTLAQRADELRTTFHDGRAALQDKAAFEKAKAPDTLVYDGDLAAHYRAAYLLETLAAVQTQRAYADGAAATIRLPNLLEVITKLLGQDWKAAVQGLQQRADEIEGTVLNQVGAPAWLETAIALALNRLPQITSESELPQLHSGWTSYTNANFVNDLLVQGDTVWAATDGGVVHWDTRTGTYVKLTTEYGLADNSVQDVFQSHEGVLWFATSYGGVSRLDTDGQWTTLSTKDGLASNYVTSIMQSNDGAMWFGTWGGVSRLDTNGQWATFDEDDGLTDNWVNSIFQNTNGTFWFGTYNGGVSRLDKSGDWTTFTKDNGLADNNVQAIAESTDGAMWFGTWGGASRMDRSDSWSTFTIEDGLADNYIYAIAQSTDNALWFGTLKGGVSRLDASGHWTTLTTEDGLADNSVMSIVKGMDDTLWFGTGGFWASGSGISRLDANGHWATFTTNDYLVHNHVSAIAQSVDSGIWLGTNNGVSYVDANDRWTTFRTEDGLAHFSINTIFQAKDGAVWFGTGNGVSRLDVSGRWTTFTSEDGLVGNNVQSIIQSIDGTWWFGTGSLGCRGCGQGASRFDASGHWTTFTIENGLPDNDVRVIVQSSDGMLWFGTSGGVSNLDTAGHWTTFTTQDGLADNYVTGIIQSSDGALWFGTWGGGVSRLDSDGHWTTFTTNDGLASNRVSFIFQSADGALWFATSTSVCGGCAEGVSRFGANGRWATFTTADGLAHNEVLTIAQSTDGAMWFGTKGGASRLDAEAVRRLSTDDGASQPNEPVSTGSTGWEYQRIDGGSVLGSDPAGVANLLNPLGSEGWEMAGVTASIFIMKRALANPGAWEYRIVNGNPADVANLLNPLGKEGWEVAGVTATFFILKRPLTNPNAWEYQSVTLAGDPVSTGALLNPLGQVGWEMAGATGPFLILKRPLVDPMAWEYQVVDGGGALLGSDPAGVANLLNPLGSEGWEMVGATATFFNLKRPFANPGQWEYQLVDGGSALGGDPAGMAALLNPLGQAGWDVAGVTGPILIMKRLLDQ